VSVSPARSGQRGTASGIFREYDVRGIFGETLFTEDAYRIGRAFAAKTHGGKIIVGRDGRLSSPALAEALIHGLFDSGVHVVDIGVGPAPMLYYAAHTLKATGGIMLTGSHNPPTHNGFKFVCHGKPFFGRDIQLLHAAIAAGAFIDGRGGREMLDIRGRYIEILLKAYDGKRDLSVAWDAGNGATGDIMEALCQKLPGTHVALNATIDGHFPAHHPDPSVPENLQQVSAKVRSRTFDLGIAFDGDGDRLGVVDDTGEMLFGDQLLMLYAADVLAGNPGATVIADVKTSQALFDEVARLGGKPLMWKTGHSLIKSKMAETGAKLGGEMSGHMFFADKYYGYDDALYAAVRLLGFLSRSGKKLSELRAALPKMTNTPEMRFDCPDEQKFQVIEGVKTRLKQSGATFSDIDGVRVQTSDGWWLLRASNTQAVLVGRCEAENDAGLERLKANLCQQLAAGGLQLVF
jgi:phosphomannomutase